MRKKPNYKKAYEDLLKLLEFVPEPETSSLKNKILDVTEDSIGTGYQFTENDLLVIKDASKGDSNGEF
jgi:hypothetical protein|tara:strand:- start:210 stop:413 length:204 start_codon:yes stop_codon:yes gene_type:complete